MAKIKYLGPEDEVTCRGGTWSSSKWTDSATTEATDEDVAVLAGNPWFSVEDPASPEASQDPSAPEPAA